MAAKKNVIPYFGWSAIDVRHHCEPRIRSSTPSVTQILSEQPDGRKNWNGRVRRGSRHHHHIQRHKHRNGYPTALKSTHFDKRKEKVFNWLESNGSAIIRWTRHEIHPTRLEKYKGSACFSIRDSAGGSALPSSRSHCCSHVLSRSASMRLPRAEKNPAKR